MPNPVWADDLVKLANLGASGVCVMIVAWVGFLLSKQRPADPQWAKLVRSYMLMGVSCAIISGCTGSINAYFKYATIERQGHELDVQGRELAAAQQVQQADAEKIARQEVLLTETNELVAKLQKSPKGGDLPDEVRNLLPAFSERVQSEIIREP